METKDLIEKISRVLTWYENREEDPFNGENIADEMYETLVDVQNWMSENV